MEKNAVQEMPIETCLPAFTHVCSSSTQGELKVYVCLACAHELAHTEHQLQCHLSLRVCGADGGNCSFIVTSPRPLSADEIRRKSAACMRRATGVRRYLSTVQVCPDYCHQRQYVYSNSSDAFDALFHCSCCTCAECIVPCSCDAVS